MKKRTRHIAPPDITPLIDVVFLLLIFFMVSTVFKKDERVLLLNLPKSSQEMASQKQKEKLIIELSKQKIAFNGKQTTLEEIGQSLDQVKDKSTLVNLHIDKTVQYDRIVKLLNLLKQKSLTNMSLITDSP